MAKRRTRINDDWTPELTLKLIREYRKRPVLWDHEYVNMHWRKKKKRNIQSMMWKDISSEMKLPEDQCKIKMSSLLSAYRRQKSKLMKELRNSPDPEAVEITPWFVFRELAFLIDKETERIRQEMSSRLNQLYHFEIDMDRIKPLLIAELKSKKDQIEFLSTIPQNNFHNSKLELNENVCEEIKLQPIKTQDDPVTSQEEIDEEIIKSFSFFVASKMQNYNEHMKNFVRKSICEVIFKADQDYFDT